MYASRSHCRPCTDRGGGASGTWISSSKTESFLTMVKFRIMRSVSGADVAAADAAGIVTVGIRSIRSIRRGAENAESINVGFR